MNTVFQDNFKIRDNESEKTSHYMLDKDADDTLKIPPCYLVSIIWSFICCHSEISLTNLDFKISKCWNVINTFFCKLIIKILSFLMNFKSLRFAHCVRSPLNASRVSNNSHSLLLKHL